jgi:hypothetical protein
VYKGQGRNERNSALASGSSPFEQTFNSVSMLRIFTRFPAIDECSSGGSHNSSIRHNFMVHAKELMVSRIITKENEQSDRECPSSAS